jgi:hypothetical protein
MIAPNDTMPDLFSIVDAGFERARETSRSAVAWHHPTPDGREAAVIDERLCVGTPGQNAYDDGYCYASLMSAVLAAARWIEEGCHGEPGGWTKHPRTGRDRPDGAAADDERAWSAAGDDERAWVCPRHPDRLPRFAGGRLFCARCGRPVDDAIRVPWPPP